MSGYATALERARAVREVMLAHGVPEVSIELQAGRPTSGDVWNALDPVMHMSHHIASSPTVGNPTPGLALVKRGRSDLPGPLANGTAGVDLVYRILTLGLANHPGTGGPLTLRGPLGAYTIPRDNARAYAWGTEYEGGYTNAVWDAVYTNRRTGKSMTFREFMGRCNAALAEALWLPGLSSRGKYGAISPGMDLSGYTGEHKTWAPGRKPDRKDYSTDSGRAEVRRYNLQEDDMPYTPDQLTAIIRKAVAEEVAPVIEQNQRLIEQNQRIRTRVNASAKTLRKMVAGGNATTQDLALAIERLADDVADETDGGAGTPGEAPAGQ